MKKAIKNLEGVQNDVLMVIGRAEVVCPSQDQQCQELLDQAKAWKTTIEDNMDAAKLLKKKVDNWVASL